MYVKSINALEYLKKKLKLIDQETMQKKKENLHSVMKKLSVVNATVCPLNI